MEPGALHGMAEAADILATNSPEFLMAEPLAQLPDIGEVAPDGPDAPISGGKFVGPFLKKGRGLVGGHSVGPSHGTEEVFRIAG